MCVSVDLKCAGEGGATDRGRRRVSVTAVAAGRRHQSACERAGTAGRRRSKSAGEPGGRQCRT